MNNIDQFDKRYSDIDIVAAPLEFSVPSKRIRRRLLDLVTLARSIADLGCGHGGSLLLFASMNKEAEITGIDYSAVAIQKAARLAAGVPRIKTEVADLSKESIPLGFDLVYCSQVIEHLENQREFVRNIHASLKDGGMLMLATVYKKSWAKYIYKNERGENVLDPTHVSECTSIPVLIGLLSSSGFVVKDYDLNLFRFPLIDIPLKILTRVFKTRWMWRIANSPITMMLRKWTGVPILGFYNVQVIAKAAKAGKGEG